jgi:hypothetical protein
MIVLRVVKTPVPFSLRPGLSQVSHFTSFFGGQWSGDATIQIKKTFTKTARSLRLSRR